MLVGVQTGALLSTLPHGEKLHTDKLRHKGAAISGGTGLAAIEIFQGEPNSRMGEILQPM